MNLLCLANASCALHFIATMYAMTRSDGWEPHLVPMVAATHKLEWFGPNWLREQIPPQIMGEHVFQIRGGTRCEKLCFRDSVPTGGVRGVKTRFLYAIDSTLALEDSSSVLAMSACCFIGTVLNMNLLPQRRLTISNLTFTKYQRSTRNIKDL